MLPPLLQDADIYLLDDVLAAVDAPVAAWLLEHAICGPLLSSKTRLLCSHSPDSAKLADQVVHLRSGRIASVLGSAEPTQEEHSSLGSQVSRRAVLQN